MDVDPWKSIYNKKIQFNISLLFGNLWSELMVEFRRQNFAIKFLQFFSKIFIWQNFIIKIYYYKSIVYRDGNLFPQWNSVKFNNINYRKCRDG